MYFHLTTRIGELGGMVLSNQELARFRHQVIELLRS